MRHRAKVQHFSRSSGPRKALLRGLVRSLVIHGRIKTTLAKAKELRRHVERAVTVGKRGGLHARRLLLSRYPNHDTVDTLLGNVVPRFQDRAGGYTRILKVGERPGDRAAMAFIEFVDYKIGAAAAATDTATTGAKKGRKAKADAVATAPKKDAAMAKAIRANKRLADKKRKVRRKIQSASRQDARA